ncbi:hypothetical protein [Deinococcus aquaticus]|uniref:hypothetical protein n=1 Tax=Deinococcus aquaticus TaxID=328692 RepID=UPI003F4787F0
MTGHNHLSTRPTPPRPHVPPALAQLIRDRFKPSISLPELRAVHVELEALGVQLITQTVDVSAAVELLAYLPRRGPSAMLGFVIQSDPLRGESVRRTDWAYTLAQFNADWDRIAVAKLFMDARPGDRVVIIAAEPTGIDWGFGPGGVYRMFTLA